jgi:hypothetical protein
MCVICVSNSGIRQPSEKQLATMFENNPHGAGYMVARNGSVYISKGYMTFPEFIHAVRYEKFQPEDAVVYHFRISTQAGKTPEMTHPFPLTESLPETKLLDCRCPLGVAHNGIIQLTTDHREKEFSDTAHYIAEFLRYFVRSADDLRDEGVLSAIDRTTRSKWALMDGSGYVATVGEFINENGLLFSNGTYHPRSYARETFMPRGSYRGSVIRGFFEDEELFDDDPFML